MKYITIILTLYSTQALAVYKNIYAGYQESDRLKAIKLNKQIIDLDKKIEEEKYSWALTTTYTDSNSFLKSLYSFSSQQTLSRNVVLELTRPSFQYGTFSVSHEQGAYDISNWSSSSLSSFSGDEVYESKNSLSYTYDFLNKSTQTDYSLIQQQNQVNILGYDIKVQQDHYDFFVAYIDAKLRIMLNRLYKEFSAKSKQRVRITAKRVKDGLSRSVELDQAQLNLLTQEETILRNKSQLREKVSIIEEIIGITFKEEDYKLVNWNYKSVDDFSFIKEISKSLEVEQLKNNQLVNELALKKLKYQSGHSLNLGLSYTKNAVEDNREDSLSDSWGSSINDEKIISLSYSIPLGESSYKYQKQKILELRNKNSLDLKNRVGEIEVQRKVLNENIVRFDEGIKILNNKIKFAKSALNKNQTLYNRGQASFEELLRAEETLINAEIGLMNMYWQYEYSVASLSYLNGNIIQFLDGYKD